MLLSACHMEGLMLGKAHNFPEGWQGVGLLSNAG